MSQPNARAASTLDTLGKAETYEAYKTIFARLTDEEIDLLAGRAADGLLGPGEKMKMDKLLKEHRFLLAPRRRTVRNKQAA